MTKTETLQDDFNDNSLDTNKWINYGGAQVVETNQELEITTTTSVGFYFIDSVNQYDLTSSYAFFKVEIGNPLLIYNDTSIFLYFLSGGTNRLNYTIEAGVLYAQYAVSGVSTTVDSVAYDASNHRWLRIRENGGTTYWDYSTDGITWTNFTSIANPIILTALTVEIGAGPWQNTTGTTISRFDNFNIEVMTLMRFMT